MKIIPALLILLSLATAGCNRSSTPVADGPPPGPSAPAGTESAPPGADLVGTTWLAHVSHPNAEGAFATLTWQFQSGGVLNHHRHWDNNRQKGTWRIEESVVVVEVGEYGKGGYGTIDLQRMGDKMKGETRWRSGYGSGWEFELEREK